ncbi:MAG: quinone-dependent dihydroorotate dehydrogenase [Balneolaceae bacterium]|nr:quinone-dependent dihydroorotate dehydrogenase [Balneolaceae bacterium]
MLYSTFLKPYLFQKDAEEAHELAVEWAERTSNSPILKALCKFIYSGDDSRLDNTYFGLHFPNPVGLAAGFDKNGVTPIAMQAMGFGFIEIGSITAKAAKGNPKPRAFRLPEDNSLINRMGLNNEGADAIVQRLKNVKLDIPLGINIAKTNDTTIHGDAAIEDYAYSYRKAMEVADYITVNISCPNTGEGKTFEDPDALKALLEGLPLSESQRIPTLVKFSVDTAKEDLAYLVDLCESFGIDGYVATNTSSDRSGLKTSATRLEQIGNGGLSGAAIHTQSTQVIGWLNEFLQGKKPIVGVGGIHDAQTAIDKIEAGANLLQIYTGMVYRGPGLVKEIKQALQRQ